MTLKLECAKLQHGKENQKIKKARNTVHYHVCEKGNHKWSHKGAKCNCNLSVHSHCGQNVAHDYNFCVLGKKLFLHPVKTIDTLANDRIENKLTQRMFLSEALVLHFNREDAMKRLREVRSEVRAKLTKKTKRAKIKKGDWKSHKKT